MTGRVKKQKPPEVIAVRSGYCGLTAEPWQHDRCDGGTTLRPCPCTCHHPEEAPVTEPTTEVVPPEPITTPTDTTPAVPDAARLPVDQASTELAAAVEAYARALVSDATDGMSWQDLAVVLHDLKAASAVLGALASNLASTLYLKAPHGDVEHPTLGVVGIRRAKDRTAWHHDEAATAYLDARVEAYAAEHGGELPSPREVLAMVREGASISGWKVTAFRAAELDVDDYCTMKPGRVSIDYRST